MSVRYGRVAPPTIDPCDVLLILPPFAGIDRPSLGLHILQSCARVAGFKVSVLYANLLLAAELGTELYEAICYAPTAELLGERIFASSAGFDEAPRTLQAEGAFRTPATRDPLAGHDVSSSELSSYVRGWSDRIATFVASGDFPIVGLNSTFEQSSSAIGLIQRVKAQRPSIKTLLGGANCEGEMALAISQLCADIDHVFSGESEETFVRLLQDLSANSPNLPRVVNGLPCKDLDGIPSLDYSDYYDQLARCQASGHIPETKHIWLPYEGSRGCWWGQKHHCTFCGINGMGMQFREKTSSKVISELNTLLDKHPSEKVLMVDNIMPSSFFETLLPALSKLDRPLHIFYEQKSNLTLHRVERLRGAGIAVIQPGIEALSSTLLKRMKKGVKAYQNIALLRYAKACGLAVNWNVLYGFPGDEEQEYQDTIEILQKIQHLHPPTGVCHLSIDRFSPYFDRSGDYGISNVRPMDSYLDVFPKYANHAGLAYHFVGDYECSHRRSPHLTATIETIVKEWRHAWIATDKPQPSLAVEELGESRFVLADTRRQAKLAFINAEQARLALSPARPSEVRRSMIEWAVNEVQVAIEIDGLLVPLATARPALIRAMEGMGAAATVRELPSLAFVDSHP